MNWKVMMQSCIKFSFNTKTKISFLFNINFSLDSVSDIILSYKVTLTIRCCFVLCLAW